MKEKIKSWLGRNWVKVFIIACLVGLYLRDSDLFWIVIPVYGIGVYLLITKSISKKLRRIILIVLWISFFTVSGLTIYVNYYLPHGPSYPTGEIICLNEDEGGGPCGEEYRENLRGLNIPDWAKFLRTSGGNLLWMGLLFAAIVISYKKEKEENLL